MESSEEGQAEGRRKGLCRAAEEVPREGKGLWASPGPSLRGRAAGVAGGSPR